jgi:hypothetical protein
MIDAEHVGLFGESYTDESGGREFLTMLSLMTTAEAEAAADSEDAEISYGDLESFERARDKLGLEL